MLEKYQQTSIECASFDRRKSKNGKEKEVTCLHMRTRRTETELFSKETTVFLM